MKNWFAYILILVLGFVLGCITFRSCSRPSETGPPVEVRRDTLTVIDTLYFDAPVAELEMVVDDTITLVDEDIDTSSTGDLLLPRTRKFYRGTGYELWVSGYRPALDGIKIFHRTSTETVYRTSYVKEPHRPWSLGISGSVVMSHLITAPEVTPSLALELGYDRRWWGIGIMAGCDYVRCPQEGRYGFAPFAGLEFRINLLKW